MPLWTIKTSLACQKSCGITAENVDSRETVADGAHTAEKTVHTDTPNHNDDLSNSSAAEKAAHQSQSHLTVTYQLNKLVTVRTVHQMFQTYFVLLISMRQLQKMPDVLLALNSHTTSLSLTVSATKMKNQTVLSILPG